MSLPIYLLRRSPSTLPSALYPPQNKEILVLIIAPLSESHASSHEAVSLQLKDAGHFINGQGFTYKKLLELVLAADKAVTL